MKVKLKLFATLRKYAKDIPLGEGLEVDLPAGSTLADLADLLKIPMDEVKICFVNGIICEPDQRIQNGDDVGMFPPIGGG